MEIVTWVLRGSLVHQDSTGHSGVIYPGLAQRMSAGTRHPAFGEERLVDADGRAITQRACAFRADVGGPRRGGHRTRIPATRDRRRTSARPAGDHRLRDARAPRSGRDHDPQQVRRAARCAHAGRRQRRTAAAPYLHLFVPRGEVTLEGAGPLHEGDAVRFTASGGQRVTATEPAEILVWEMHAGLAAA